MNEHSEIYGAFGCILISFEGDLRQLAAMIAAALNLSSLDVQSDESPPYDEIVSAEMLGWEVWLKPEQNGNGTYRLLMETEHSIEEIMQGRMHDLSPWLARLVATLCKVPTRPIARQ